ncbi:MAG: hypothetical protein KAX18_13055 [Candidatus Lokiarchaeota archaeon]|nr:hypothetical protein [Candidatus Lokiarchaeota archaeon]
MSSGTKLIIDLKLLECPFFPSCNLPKIQFLCKIPECRNCPDYIVKLEKIK